MQYICGLLNNLYMQILFISGMQHSMESSECGPTLREIGLEVMDMTHDLSLGRKMSPAAGRMMPHDECIVCPVTSAAGLLPVGSSCWGAIRPKGLTNWEVTMPRSLHAWKPTDLVDTSICFKM